MVQRRFGSAAAAIAAVAVAWPAAAVFAQAPSPAPAAAASAKPAVTCRVGAAVPAAGAAAATQQLVAKVCLHRGSGGQRQLRHSVELRAVQGGARLQQASLPAAATDSDALPEPGAVLAGSPPLLVLDRAIAAADLRLGSAELVFEAQGRLLGAARDGDWLVLVEALAAEGKLPPRLEWTVLDLEAGAVAGQAVVPGERILGVALRRDGKALSTELQLVSAPRPLTLRAEITGPDGASRVRDGRLSVRAQPAP